LQFCCWNPCSRLALSSDEFRAKTSEFLRLDCASGFFRSLADYWDTILKLKLQFWWNLQMGLSSEFGAFLDPVADKVCKYFSMILQRD